MLGGGGGGGGEEMSERTRGPIERVRAAGGKRSTRYGATPIASPVVQSAFRTGVASLRSSHGISFGYVLVPLDCIARSMSL